MATRVSYPLEIKMKAIELRLAGVTKREVMEQLNIRNKSQVQTWLRWYHAGELNRLEQPVGKQYGYGKGPEYVTEMEKLRAENRYLKEPCITVTLMYAWPLTLKRICTSGNVPLH